MSIVDTLKSTQVIILVTQEFFPQHDRSNMINLGIFKITFESWSKFVWFKTERTSKELIIDFGYWRVYLSS
jgi:hypothetical protein